MRVGDLGVNGIDGNSGQPYSSRVEQKAYRFELRLPPEKWGEVDEWRRRQPDLPTRLNAVRRMIDMALEADREAAAKAPKKK